MPAPIVVEAAQDGGFVIRTHDPAPLPVAILFAGDAPDCLAYLAKWAGLQPPADQPTNLKDIAPGEWRIDREAFKSAVAAPFSRPEVQAEVIRRAEEALDAATPEGGFFGNLKRGFQATSAEHWRGVLGGGKILQQPDLEDALDALRAADIPCGVQVFRHDHVTAWIGEIDKALAPQPHAMGYRMRIPAEPEVYTVFHDCHGSNALAVAAKWLLEQLAERRS